MEKARTPIADLDSYADYRDIRQALISGKITCVDLVEHHLNKIELHAQLNAFIAVYADEARLNAKAIDQKIKAGKAGKLAGMVVGIKDVLAYKDHGLEASSKILKGFVSQYNATAVQRLLDEDAIIIGRQNCDEFAMGSSNENSAHGHVRNAADTSRVPGGSSGGSAVAVQAGMCQVSLGSDTGGSVRQPAAFCGVIGLKPTYSRISRHGLVAYASSFDCIGIFSKNIYDNALVLEVIAGEDEYDSTVSRKAVDTYTASIPESSAYRICYYKNIIDTAGLQPEINQAFKNSLEKLKTAGHTVEAVEFDLMDYLLPTYYILITAESSSNLSRYDGVRYGQRSKNFTNLESMYKQTRSEGFGKEVQRRIMLGTFVLSASYYDAYYAQAQKVRQVIRSKTKALLSDYDFILLPSTPTTAFPLAAHSANPIEMYLADIFTVQANVAGISAISIPAGKNEKGPPLGFQIMGNDFDEAKLFNFADT
ncbi:MAG TPA: Asp-tRNA(Asn)/Glu-tRNA(Gln) amidotransferase subunit GatA, partial [Cyclobacteriaceae bacterium]|nr:Asp-tRNA(Asn)/Glu-tRNA(Gln) amidotransferase subunit GatA [Cyclobacteriaceae bacterium]